MRLTFDIMLVPDQLYDMVGVCTRQGAVRSKGLAWVEVQHATQSHWLVLLHSTEKPAETTQELSGPPMSCTPGRCFVGRTAAVIQKCPVPLSVPDNLNLPGVCVCALYRRSRSDSHSGPPAGKLSCCSWMPHRVRHGHVDRLGRRPDREHTVSFLLRLHQLVSGPLPVKSRATEHTPMLFRVTNHCSRADVPCTTPAT